LGQESSSALPTNREINSHTPDTICPYRMAKRAVLAPAPKPGTPNPDRFIGLVGVIVGVLFFLLQENGVVVGWIFSLVLYLLLTLATVWALHKYGIPGSTNLAAKVTIIAAGIVVIVGLGGWGTYKQFRHEHPVADADATKASDQAQLLALARLTQEGWRRKLENGHEFFELENQPLPDMSEATAAFKTLGRPVSLRLQSVPSLLGLHLLGSAHVCHDLAILASNLTTLDELGTFTDLSKLAVSQVPFDNGDYIDASAIGNLTQLKTLSLNAVRPQSSDFIAKLSALEKLDLTATPIRTTAAVRGLRSLTTLSLLNTYSSNLTWLPELKKLEELSVGEPELPSFSSITQPLHLKTLHVMSYHDVDTGRFPIDSSLEELYLYGDHTDLSGLRNTPHLRKLYLQSIGIYRLGHIESVDTIGRLAELNNLTIDQYDVTNIDFVKSCRSLTAITLFNDPIQSIEPLANLPDLSDVKIARLPIQDVSPQLTKRRMRMFMTMPRARKVKRTDEPP
jgi:hypothetical protein